MKLLIAISSYRATDLTIECLRSLNQEIWRVPGTKVAVCENGTGEDAAERLRQAIDDNEWSTWVDLMTVYPNRGFTGGTNAAIRPFLQSDDRPEYVLLLNSDTIVTEHALDALISFMDTHPRAGVAGSMLVAPDGTVESSPFRFPGIATELDRGLRLGLISRLLSPWSLVLPKRDAPMRAGWVSGASLLVRRTMIEQIGLLDEGLYTYFDDPDICMRAARADWETWYVPESRVIHLGGATTGLTGNRLPIRHPAYWHQARRRFFLKSYGVWYTALADAAYLLGLMIWRLRRWLMHKPDTDPPHLLIDAIHNSVFCAGVRVPVVENPAMCNTTPSPAAVQP